MLVISSYDDMKKNIYIIEKLIKIIKNKNKGVF